MPHHIHHRCLKSPFQLISRLAKAVFTGFVFTSFLMASSTFTNAETNTIGSDGVKHVDTSPSGNPPSGQYSVIVEHDETLSTHTIYRPKWTNDSTFPIVVWGEGACEDAGLMFPEFLSEIASHGYIVIADGPPVRSKIRQPGQPTSSTDSNTENTNQTTTQSTTQPATQPRRRPVNLKPDGTDLIAALDWVEAKNSDKQHRFFQKANMKKIAAMGMSCGGLMAYGASSDPRISTVGIWNSGLLQADQAIYDALHTSIIIITGGETDVAYPNGKRDYETLKDSKPIYYGYYPSIGHFGTYTEDNGGVFGEVAVAWLNWQLKNDRTKTGKKYLSGKDCPVCNDKNSITHSHNLD